MAGLENSGVGQSDRLRSEDMVCAATGVAFGGADSAQVRSGRCGGVSSHGCPQVGGAGGVGVEVVGESVVSEYVCGGFRVPRGIWPYSSSFNPLRRDNS